MGNLNLKAKDIREGLKGKLRLQNIKTTTETFGDYYLDGKFWLTAKMPNEHGGSGDVSPQLIKSCAKRLHLTVAEFADLVRCPMSGQDFERVIKERFGGQSAR